MVEPSAASEWVEHRPAVRGFVLRLVRNEALAEDLAQETFLRAQRSASTHRGEASVRSWLCAIALNLVRDHFRSAGRSPEASLDAGVLEQVVSSDDDAEEAVLRTEMSACIAEFMARLPSPQYDVLALHDAAGLTHAEIAAQLEISVANSRVVLHRGRAALREILKENCILSFDADGTPCERRSASDCGDCD
jgi:RNA polymerase sigma-70 factor (ECF subfamily)